MNKGLIVGIIGTVSLVGVGCVLINEDRRMMLKNKWNGLRSSLKQGAEDLPIEEAGHPETDMLDNADMVSEGSQYGVHYYNKVRQT
ncbi:hypothetical protein J416_15572 [Gracilibacillus halophilus YIM-C55.5]|uniref:Lipoprotein n=1 Tax=Gracilibacillus halophilus YIM-C55.5 TaxID=1308866 RepID=N4WH73_9BACI|nr:hypothetical protein [Gracilibacillus halophilus]ENH95537.1 hypothetical protein J416_15572 [Gracilibacillus halophilus YIM-C55.5]